MRQRRRGREPDPEALLTSGQPEGQGDVCFSGSRVPQSQDIFLALEELAARQFQHHRFI